LSFSSGVEISGLDHRRDSNKRSTTDFVRQKTISEKDFDDWSPAYLSCQRPPLPFPSGLLLFGRSVPPVALPPLTPPDLVPAPFPLLPLGAALVLRPESLVFSSLGIFVHLQIEKTGPYLDRSANVISS